MSSPRLAPVSASQSWVAHRPAVINRRPSGLNSTFPESPCRHPRHRESDHSGHSRPFPCAESHDAPTVGTEGHAQDRVVIGQVRPVLPCGHVPNPGRPALIGGEDEAAVGAERGAQEVDAVFQGRGDRPACLHRPDPGLAPAQSALRVAGGRDDLVAIGAEGRPGQRIADRERDELSARIGLPDLRDPVGADRDGTAAIAAERRMGHRPLVEPGLDQPGGLSHDGGQPEAMGLLPPRIAPVEPQGLGEPGQGAEQVALLGQPAPLGDVLPHQPLQALLRLTVEADRRDGRADGQDHQQGRHRHR